MKARPPLSTSRHPIYASTDPRVMTVPLAGGSTMTLSTQRYAEAESRWQARRAWLGARSRRSGRDQLDMAKAKRTRLGRDRRAYVHGSEPTPKGKYSDAEIQKLGEQGKAMRKPGGGHWFPNAVANDIPNAVAAYLALPPGAREGVRAWIVKRAREMGLDEQLPKGWGELNPGLHPNEVARIVGTALPGGPTEAGGSTGGRPAV